MTRIVRLPVRIDGKGRRTGGGLISRGHLYKTLSNPIYIGRLAHKGEVHEGLHVGIIDQLTWDRVQQQLANHLKGTKSLRRRSDALLAGKIFDDRGNAMSPSYAAKGGRRWRYYVSQALLQGRKADAGSLARVPAGEVEAQVGRAIRGVELTLVPSATAAGIESPSTDRARARGEGIERPFGPDHSDERAIDIRDAIERVTISQTMIRIQLSEAVGADAGDRIVTVPWTAPSPHRRREIIQGQGARPSATCPMRTKARAVFLEASRRAHRWLDELLADPRQSIESLAIRQGKTERSIRMTLSLAFLAPALVKAAIEGRLPRGFGVARLVDLPMAWSDQWNALGLSEPAQT